MVKTRKQIATPEREAIQTFAEEVLDQNITLALAIRMLRGVLIQSALGRSSGNVTVAASMLGTHRNTIHGDLKKMKEYHGR